MVDQLAAGSLAHLLKKHKDVPGQDIVQVSMKMEPPEKICGQYYESKRQNERLRRFPNWDISRSTPSIELIRAQDELNTANNKLRAKQEWYLEKRKQLDDQWKEIETKELKLKKAFKSFNKFIRENQEKRERAERRITEEQKTHAIKDEEMLIVNNKIAKMKNVQEKLRNYCQKYKFYEDYLADVASQSIEFKTINDVLNRYDALADAREDLIERQKTDLESLEEERANMVYLLQEKANVLMGLNNKLAELQSRYEKAKNKSFYWEIVVNKVKNKATRQLLQIDQVEEACYGLYLQMCQRKEVEPEIPKSNIEDQLLFIKRTILEFQKIKKIAQRRINRETASVKTETGRSQKSEKSVVKN